MEEVTFPLWLFGLLVAVYVLGCAFLWTAQNAYEAALPEGEEGMGWEIVPAVVFWPVTVPIFMTVGMAERLGRWAARQ